MYTIRDLCRISKLSRSTILYYDSLGLLKPTERSTANYRIYSDKSLEVLRKICLYREAGVSLADIGLIIVASDNDDAKIQVLENTLTHLNDLAYTVQKRQILVIDMLKALGDKRGSADQCDEAFENLMKWISSFTFDIDKSLGIEDDMEE